MSRLQEVTGEGVVLDASTRRLLVAGGQVALVAGGGALTGYLAARSWAGALIGATAHLALYSLVSALWAAETNRWLWGACGLGFAGLTAYLFYRRHR